MRYDISKNGKTGKENIVSPWLSHCKFMRIPGKATKKEVKSKCAKRKTKKKGETKTKMKRKRKRTEK